MTILEKIRGSFKDAKRDMLKIRTMLLKLERSHNALRYNMSDWIRHLQKENRLLRARVSELDERLSEIETVQKRYV